MLNTNNLDNFLPSTAHSEIRNYYATAKETTPTKKRINAELIYALKDNEEFETSSTGTLKISGNPTFLLRGLPAMASEQNRIAPLPVQREERISALEQNTKKFDDGVFDITLEAPDFGSFDARTLNIILSYAHHSGFQAGVPFEVRLSDIGRDGRKVERERFEDCLERWSAANLSMNHRFNGSDHWTNMQQLLTYKKVGTHYEIRLHPLWSKLSNEHSFDYAEIEKLGRNADGSNNHLSLGALWRISVTLLTHKKLNEEKDTTLFKRLYGREYRPENKKDQLDLACIRSKMEKVFNTLKQKGVASLVKKANTTIKSVVKHFNYQINILKPMSLFMATIVENTKKATSRKIKGCGGGLAL